MASSDNHVVEGDRVDFFVSHAGADRAWAEWAAWQLIEAGYSVELDVWDWAAGRNFVIAMSNALDRCDRVVALFSSAYFERERYTNDEWAVAALHVPGAGEGRLIPLRIESVPSAAIPAVLRPLVYRDLFGIDEGQARQVLLEAVVGRRRPGDKPAFPRDRTPGGLSSLGGSGPRLPGTVPRVWNIPARNPGFTGRDGLLVDVRRRLLAGDRAVVQAFQGMGGVGKTLLAIEYAHRFAGAYGLAWWISAETPGLMGDQFATLGSMLACAEPGAGVDAVRAAVMSELRDRGRWLLIFDNAEDPSDIQPWLPGGGGHVLITSREHVWSEIAVAVEVDVLDRLESVAILRDRVAELDEVDADKLAAQLGDLPLAIAQAAGFMAETGLSARAYIDLLGTQAARLLDQAAPRSYPRSLAAATRLTAARLEREDPAAAQLASLCAFLAPAPIPDDLFTTARSLLPDDLAAIIGDPLAWRSALAQLSRPSMIRIDHRGLVMHRLTQTILRERLTGDEAASTRQCSELILAANDPGDPSNPVTWARWAQLMPHLLAVEPAATNNQAVRWMACNACLYLLSRGDIRTSHNMAQNLRQHWRERLGDDHENTLTATTYVAWALRDMGRYAEARDLDQDTLARRRRVLGENHHETLTSASNLAHDLYALGEAEAARDLDQDTLARRRQVLGEDHPDTLASASNLANSMRALGDVAAARDLDRDNLARRRRVLGEDHPETVGSASNLAIDLYALGEVESARDLDRDTWERRVRILGEDHPSTLGSASNLANELYALGEVESARDLDRDTWERRVRILGKDHPDSMASASNLASDMFRLGDLQAAADLHRDTLDRRRRVLGENHPDTIRSERNLARVLQALDGSDDG